MKFTAATVVALAVTPLALAKSVHNAYLGRRSVSREVKAVDGVGSNSVVATPAQIAQLERLLGLNRGRSVEVILLWVNLGGGVPTTIIQPLPPAAGTPPPPPAAATPAVGGRNTQHNVTVGGPTGLAFNPPEIKAAIGDTVIFTFLSQNHTVTQSAFETPCSPLQGGMDSGFQPNANNAVVPAPQVAMQVMVDTPLWFYCRQNGHCGKGMTFSINPSSTKTHAMFQAMAIAQNGTGAGSAITGNGGNANPRAGAGGAAPGPVSPPTTTSSSTRSGGGGGGGAAAAPAAAQTGLVSGTGQRLADGSCLCAVQCNFPGFPNALQGRDSFGGFGGAVPMAAMR